MPDPTPELVGLLQDIFGAKDIKGAGKFPILSSAPKRTVGDATMIAEAQRIYDPSKPSVPMEVKGPNAKQQETGTGPAMELEDNYIK
ncbi:MAG: hypothetical protein WC455_16020 [Dehalococcoidia bacterium]|jgi:hypothetical protein